MDFSRVQNDSEVRKWKNDVRKLQKIIEQLKGQEFRKKVATNSTTERDPFRETTNLFDQNNTNNANNNNIVSSNNLIQQLQQKVKRLTDENCALREANRSLEEKNSVSTKMWQ